MICINKVYTKDILNGEALISLYVGDWRGSSDEVKPLLQDGVEEGSTFLETDTGKIYIFNVQSNSWVEFGNPVE